MSLMLSRVSRRLRILAGVVVVMLVAIGTITAQFATFEEGLEGEIWELLQPDLDLPDSDNGNWASGVAWVSGELVVVDNLSGATSKFNSNLQFVDTSGADWQGAPGTPSEGWQPNEAVAAKLTLNNDPTPVGVVLVSDCRYNGGAPSSRVLAFLPDGTHQFTIHFPEDPTVAAYQPCLNGIAMGPGAYFHLSGVGAGQTLQLIGDFAVAWPERLGLEQGGALIYRGDDSPATATFTLTGSVFEASQPNWQLTGGADESGDPTIPAVKAVTGIAFDGSGNFFMVDSWTGRLHGYQNTVVAGEPAFVHRFAFGTPLDPDDEASTSIELPEAYGMTLWPSALGDRLLITVPLENRAVVYRPMFSAGGELENVSYLFKLDGLGAVSGLPHSSAFDAASGRVAIGDSANNSVKIFQAPALAIFDMKITQVVGDTELTVNSVCRSDAFNVRFSITVPEGRSPVQRVKPVLLVDGIPSTAAPTPAGDYEPNGAGEVGTVDHPLGPRDVITYSYALTAPDVAGAVDLTGFAQAFSTSVDLANNFAPITDILARSLELAVADCAGNQPPTITPEVVSSTSTFSGPNAAGWLKVEPVAPAPMVFTVRLTATDIDGGIRRITYQLSGVNAGAEQTVAIDALPDGSFPGTVTLDVPVIGDAEALQVSPQTLAGSTLVTFSAQDNNFRPSAPGSVLLKLDNGLPNICFTVPYHTAIAKTPTEHWWNGMVTIPVSTNDAQGPTPVYGAPVAPELQGHSLVFALEGSGQFATLIAQDHVGHLRTLSSNTPLDVCGAGRTGTNVNIDLTLPTIAADLAGGATVYQPGQMLTLTAADPPAATSPRKNDGFSGVRRIEYSFDGFATAPIVTSGAIAMIPLTQPVTIHYRSVDWAGNRSATASRTFTVDTINDPPNAVDDTATTAYQTPIVIAVLANDSAGDAGDTLTIQSLGAATGGTVAANLNGTVTFTPAAGFSGAAAFTYTVTDAGGLTDIASVAVTVGPSNVPPICSAATTSADLWPPNHQQVYVTVSGVVDPEGQPIAVTFNSILQDEPTNSVGQGNTMQDGGIEQNGTRAWVRAERSGTNKVPGDGRVYLIGFTARDAGGLTCTGIVRVDVPHDQRGKPAVLSPGRWNALTGQVVTPP